MYLQVPAEDDFVDRISCRGKILKTEWVCWPQHYFQGVLRVRSAKDLPDNRGQDNVFLERIGKNLIMTHEVKRAFRERFIQ